MNSAGEVNRATAVAARPSRRHSRASAMLCSLTRRDTGGFYALKPASRPGSPTPFDRAAARLRLAAGDLAAGQHIVERRAQPGGVLAGVLVVGIGRAVVRQPV